MLGLLRRLMGEPIGLDAENARALRAAKVAAALRAGAPVTDAEFDAVFTAKIRGMSRVHWTPVRVAQRCATLLSTTEDSRVLDIGSGVGKFCTIAALSVPGRFEGIEQYAPLVECAREIASLMGATGASFVHGAFRGLSPEAYDGIYLFNPFEENDWGRPPHLERAEAFVRGTFDGGVAEARRFLALARPGTRAVTYNGMGGTLPSTYALAGRETLGCDIEVWIKESSIWSAGRATARCDS